MGGSHVGAAVTGAQTGQAQNPFDLMPGLAGARNAPKTRQPPRPLAGLAAINSRRAAGPLLVFFFSLLHTYLVPNSPAQDSGGSVWKACIAQRGVAPCSIVLRGHRGRNF